MKTLLFHLVGTVLTVTHLHQLSLRLRKPRISVGLGPAFVNR